MAKFKAEKYKGDLGIMREHIAEPSLACKEQIDAYLNERMVLKQKTIDELFSYYHLPKNEKASWKKLAWKLAEGHVPAMHFKKKNGAGTKWDFVELMRLYALVQILEERRPQKEDLPYESLFNERFIQAASVTALKPLVKKVKPKTLQNRYLEFVRSPMFLVTEKMLNEMTPEQRLSFFMDLVSGAI